MIIIITIIIVSICVCVREQFLAIDARVLAVDMWSARVPPPGVGVPLVLPPISHGPVNTDRTEQTSPRDVERK